MTEQEKFSRVGNTFRIAKEKFSQKENFSVGDVDFIYDSEDKVYIMYYHEVYMGECVINKIDPVIMKLTEIKSKIEEGKKSLHSAILMLDLDNIPERREWLIKQLEYLVRDVEREIEDEMQRS